MDITAFVASHREDALLLGDYNSYRGQLSRRLLTVRRKLGRTTPKGKKYASKAPITAEDISSNHEFIHLLLLTSERAWAHAMHMKSTHSADPSQKGITGSTRRHIISRLHKAATYANELTNLLNNRQTTGSSAVDILEARAYATSLSGAAEFEKQSWEASLKSYSESRIIYATLLSSTKKDIFKDLLSTTIDPSIRYSAYQLQLPRTTAIPTIAKRYCPRSNAEFLREIEKLDPDALSEEPSQVKKGPAASSTNFNNFPKNITWRSRTVDLEDASIASALAVAFSAAENLQNFLSSPQNVELPPKERAAAYDDLLTASQDAVDATKHAIDELVSEGVGQGDKRMQGLQVTRTAVNYMLVGWRVGRNRVLCGEKDGAILEVGIARKPKKAKDNEKKAEEKEEARGRKLARLRERVALYDAILQSLDSVKELPGVAADEAFLKELQGKRLYFQALKCLAIGRSHDLLSNRKNAFALFDRALNLSSSSIPLAIPPSSAKRNAPPALEIHPSEREFLHRLLQAEVFRFRALLEIDNIQSADKTSDDKQAPVKIPLIERLDQYPVDGVDLTNLVTYPPRLEPVPVKPLFFDVAWNYIDYPGRAAKVVEQREAVAESKAAKGDSSSGAGTTKKGWFGFGR